jgi:hypothetical protein
MQYQTLHFRIQGIAPLLMHSGQLADPQNAIAKALRQISEKRAKTEADHAELARLEWYGSLYLAGGEPCIPGELLEALLIEAAKKSKRGPAAKAGILCEQHSPLLYAGPRHPDALWADGGYTLTAAVRVQGSRVMRTRPIFRQWEAAIAVKYLDGLLNASEVEQFLKLGGMIIGLGDWRPKFGRFVVV